MTPGDDPLDELRRNNPAQADDLPSASLARVRARTQEAISMGQRPRRERLPALAGLGAAVTAIALFAIVALPRTGGTAPPSAPPIAVATPTPGASPTTGGGGMASCIEQYSLDALKRRTFAFDGTVASISGDEVTFTVRDTYRGAAGATVTLTATGMTGTTSSSAGGPTLSVGERYLVAGDDRFVWGCGFTQPYDAGVAAAWADALR
jgi:hypothetical protein